MVRDKVPDELRRLERVIVVDQVAGDEYVRRLREKLVEECQEAIGTDPTSVVEELVDVLEVVIALAAIQHVSLEGLIAAAAEKRKRLGGFCNGTVLVDNGLPESRQIVAE